jgi:predicted metalloendopeptidase
MAAAAMPVASPAALDVAGIDRAIDPCTDFYAYANRRWLDATPIPESRPVWGSFTMLLERSEHVVHTALEEELQKPLPADGSGRRKVLQYYASGLDLAAIERAGLKPLAPQLARIAALDGRERLAGLLAKLAWQGIEAPLAFAVRQDLKDSKRYIPELGQAGLGLPERDAYFRDDARSKETRERYRAFVTRVLALAGDGADAAARQAETILAFETELARAAMTPVERRDVDKTYNKRSLAQLAAEAPGFDWAAYFADLGLRDTSEINVTQPAFAKAVAGFAASRPLADWRVYLRWHVLRGAAPRLPEPIAKEAFEFNEGFLRGVKARPERWREVISAIGGRYGGEPMAQALVQFYVERAFPTVAKTRALALVGNVKAALGDRLRTLEWMGPETRARALEKLEAMRVKIGYPDRWRDFSGADVGPYAYADNWLRANEFRHRRDLARIGRPVDRAEWMISPHIVNAFYNGRLNEIVFPAAILQAPFFDLKADDAVNYGGIGMVIGHEITHGFDDRGRRFDADGNLRDWWTEADAKRYKERADRIERQYSGYVGIDGIPVNGRLTLGENISDIGGAKIAYLALQKALQSSAQGPIDGLSPEQRFFLSLATIWRSRYRDAQERLLLRTDGHSPPRFRVAGTIAHMPEFARAFGCDAAKTVLADDLRAEIW